MSRLKGDRIFDIITGQHGTVIGVVSNINETTGKKEFQYLITGVPISPNYPADRNNPVATWRNSWEIKKG